MRRVARVHDAGAQGGEGRPAQGGERVFDAEHDVRVEAQPPVEAKMAPRPAGHAHDEVRPPRRAAAVLAVGGLIEERLAGDARGADEARVPQRGPERRVVEDHHELLSYPEWPLHEEAERAAAPLERRRPGLAHRLAERGVRRNVLARHGDEDDSGAVRGVAVRPDVRHQQQQNQPHGCPLSSSSLQAAPAGCPGQRTVFTCTDSERYGENAWGWTSRS